jgi:hypothetical protein
VFASCHVGQILNEVLAIEQVQAISLERGDLCGDPLKLVFRVET